MSMPVLLVYMYPLQLTVNEWKLQLHCSIASMTCNVTSEVLCLLTAIRISLKLDKPCSIQQLCNEKV